MKNIRTMMAWMILPIFGLVHSTPATALETFDMRAAAVLTSGDPLATINSAEFESQNLGRAQPVHPVYFDTGAGAANTYDLYFGTQIHIGDDYFWTNTGTMPNVKSATVVSYSTGAADNRAVPIAADLAAWGLNTLQAYGIRSEDWTLTDTLDAKGAVHHNSIIKPVNPVPEAATIFLIGAGLIALTSIIRKKAHHRPK